MHFAMRANALAVFPGGFGTLDELFEILTLKQTRKCALMPVILFSRDYWRSTVNFEALGELEMIDRQEAALFEIVDTAEEAWSVMVGRGLMARTPLSEA
jgi:predicted Rossmann-fold nucleotide-binding protein